MLRNIDIDLLRSFITVYESGNFSHAAERLGRTQSTISQQIKKLEDILGKPVFTRNTRSLSITTEGEVLLPYARQIISLNDEVFGRISKADISGVVKLGAPEAFTTNHLPEVLVKFAKSHPSVALEVECGLSHDLYEDFEKGNYDLILIKRDNKSKIYGNKVWREELIWVGQEKKSYKRDSIIPLILSPSPCVYRTKMIDALEKKRMKWNTIFTSGSINGRIAAARSGLGVTAIPKEILPQVHGLISLEHNCGLPTLAPIEIDLIQNKQKMSDAAQRLAEHIVFALENDPSLSPGT